MRESDLASANVLPILPVRLSLSTTVEFSLTASKFGKSLPALKRNLLKDTIAGDISEEKR